MLGNFFSGIFGGVGAIVTPVAKIFEVREQRKNNQATAQGKLALAKETGKQDIILTDAEGEAIMASNMANSWKDEYVTLIITLPIPLILLGALWDAFTEDSRVLEGTAAGLKALEELGMDYNFVLTAVVLSAIGLKMWRAK